MENLRLRRLHLSPPETGDQPATDQIDHGHHLTRDEMKHSFALQPLSDAAFGSAREFLCHCVRCKWTFQVSPDRGTIVAFNNVGEPLDGAEATRRIATFAEGPCPAFAGFPEYDDARDAQQHHSILQPILHLLGLDHST
jgi:hypothetical protein